MPKCTELLPCDWLISNLCYQAIEQVYLIKWLVSIYIYIYSHSVSLVLCELFNVIVVCLAAILFFVHLDFWLIVCSSFSMNCLHIIFPSVTVFDWHVSLTSASLGLYLE